MLSTVSLSKSSNDKTSTVFHGLDDDLRDARRVLSHGQEEDLRYALDRILNKVEELVSTRPTSFCFSINTRSIVFPSQDSAQDTDRTRDTAKSRKVQSAACYIKQ